MSSVTGPITYGTDTKAIYTLDVNGDIDRTQPATYILNNVVYKDMPADFVDLLMTVAAKYNL